MPTHRTRSRKSWKMKFPMRHEDLLIVPLADLYFLVLSVDYEVLKAIKTSDQLLATFKYNFKKDPYPSWQFFGSSTGMLRYYPGE